MGDEMLSKRALKYIAFTIGEFLEKAEIVTNTEVDIDNYQKALKSIKKMIKKLPDKPEKYIDFDYLTSEMIEEIESAALAWEQERMIH